MTRPWRRRNVIILPVSQAAELTAPLATIDEFLRSEGTGSYLTGFLATRGAQFPGHDASILIDELSFTAMSFRNLLAADDDRDHRQEKR